MLSVKSYCILYTLSSVVRTAYKQTTYTIRQEVAYKRLKTMGNNKTASCIRKPQVISGGGVRTPCTLPLDPPLRDIYHIK